MEKPFLEVFPGLNIADELKELFETCHGGKGHHDKGQKLYSCLYPSPRLIHKKNIYALEEGSRNNCSQGDRSRSRS